MEFAVLGPLAVRLDGAELELGGPKQRALLAMLLLRANQVVSRDRLIDGLWGERPPVTAAHTLDNYVSRLRKMLGVGRITTRPPGYVLQVEPGEVDLDRFEQLLGVGREHLARGDGAQARESLHAALALWRGTALEDLRDERFAQVWAERIDALRLQALEDRFEADLSVGRSSDVVPELEAAMRTHPFRERLLAQLMLALYRAGRQAEALGVFQAGRQCLSEELGLEPGPELRELQRKILAHDDSLLPHVGGHVIAARLRRTGPRRRSVAVASAAAVTVAIGVVIGIGGTNAPTLDAASSQVVALEFGSGAPTGRLSLAGAPTALAAVRGALWVAAPGEGAVSRVDVASRAVADSVPVDGSPALVAAEGGSVWTASALGDRIQRIDAASGAVTQTVRLGLGRAAAVASGGGTLWVADAAQNSLIEVDPTSGRIRRRLPLEITPSALAYDRDVMWVADYGGDSVAEVDLRSGQTLSIVHVGGGPSSVAVGLHAVWVANALDATVSRIDTASGSVVATIPVGSGPTALAVAGGLVWVANQYSATVSRIDSTNAVVGTAAVGGEPTSLAPADGALWVGVRPLLQHRGGTLQLLHTRPLNIDPALNVDVLPLQADALTHDGLVTYNHVPGPAGTQLVPDLAITLPTPTDGGTTYTFRLRSGIRYSDGRTVRTSDFRRALERAFRLRSANSAAFTGLLGAPACSKQRCDLTKGIVTDERTRTVTFHLRSPDPEFLNSLASAQAAPVPPRTPFRPIGFHPMPGTGPYKIARAGPSEIRYVRNPFFREWSHAAQPDGNPDQIVMKFGLSQYQEVRAIEDGRADWSADNLPARLLPSLRRHFDSRLHALTIPTTDFVQFNTTLPPFNDRRVRQALNLALDRREIVHLYGGTDLATPTCQILPAGLPGYRRYCPYRHDAARARQLVSASGTRGQQVTLWSWTDDPTISPRVARYIADALRRLGYHTRLHLVTHAYLENPPASVFTQIQLIPGSWGDTPNGFFTTWLSCSGTNDHGYFCDHLIDRQIAHAETLESARPRAANALWARLDRELVNRAVFAPLINDHGLELVSNRVQNYQSHPYWGLIADQLWIR